MTTRRTFLKSLLVGASVLSAPAIAKVTDNTTEPDPTDTFVFDDIGSRGIGEMTEREQQAVQSEVVKYLEKDVHWGIPGTRDDVYRFVVLGNYLVTYKLGRRNRVYIEVERTFHGNPPQFLTEHIDRVWKQYMDKRTRRLG